MIVKYLRWLIQANKTTQRMYMPWNLIEAIYHVNPEKWLWETNISTTKVYTIWDEDAYSSSLGTLLYNTLPLLGYVYETKEYKGMLYNESTCEIMIITTSLRGYWHLIRGAKKRRKNKAELDKQKESQETLQLKEKILNTMQADIKIEIDKSAKLIVSANQELQKLTGKKEIF